MINNLTNVNFSINNNKFQLLLNNIIVSESDFNIIEPDKYIKQKYVTLSNFKTISKFQRKGYATYLLEQIFNYVKTELNINYITLLVDKNNTNAVNLYFKCGFEIFQEFNDNNPCFILIKKM